MPGAARLGDTISHGGSIIEASDNVLTNGRGSARVGDKVWCNRHNLRTIVTGSGSVLVNGRGFARIGDSISCGATIVTGSSDVIVGD
jgi:uncharacterized Zn-binding protein involved in type VI secretion